MKEELSWSDIFFPIFINLMILLALFSSAEMSEPIWGTHSNLAGILLVFVWGIVIFPIWLGSIVGIK